MRIAPNPRAVVSRATRARRRSLPSVVAAVAAATAVLAACADGAAAPGASTRAGAAMTTAMPAVTTTIGESATTMVAAPVAPIATTTLAPESLSVPTTTVAGGAATTTTVAPVATTGAPRRAGPRLEVSQTTGLDPAGVRVTVRGSGYDPSKGVYVGVCTQAAPSATAATCIGGVDVGGDSPSLVWVSSSPPPYAVGLTQPYGADGSFVVSILVVARGGEIDCRVVRCGIVTRNDHLRYSDRSQDVFVPISFAG